MVTQVESAIAKAAPEMVKARLSVIPCKLDKTPALATWKPFQDRLPDESELPAMFSGVAAIAIVAGRVSGNLEMTDFDVKAELFPAWSALVEEEAPGLLSRLVIEKSQSGGKHVVYRCTEIQIPGSAKLAQKTDCEGKVVTLIETRGEGGYFLCAPSPSYVLEQGTFFDIPAITANEREILIRCARALNSYVDHRTVKNGNDARSQGNRPGDDFNQRGDIRRILKKARWSFVRNGGVYEHWRRPGKDRGISASLIEGQVFNVFSTNAQPFEGGQAYSKFAVYALLAHQGDFHKAAAELAGQGYGASGGFVSEGGGGIGHAWGDPEPLPRGLPPVDEFDFTTMPSSILPWIDDVSERMQCPADYLAVGCLVAAGATVGKRLGIRPKRFDDWVVLSNVWGMIIGPPSVMKTPALQEMLRPLVAMERAAFAQFSEEMKRYEAAALVSKVDAKEIKSATKRMSPQAACEYARQKLDEVPKEPALKRLLVNDATVEKLGELLRDNPTGLLVFRDELTGFLRTLEKQGHENDRAFFLEAWNGLGRYVYDRIGRGTIVIENAIVSVLGSIQPGPLKAYLLESFQNGRGADGLMQRFQLAVYPDVPKDWRFVDRNPNNDAYEAMQAAFGRLLTVGTTSAQADNMPYLHFDNAAQDVFDVWYAQLEHRLRGENEHSVMIAHLAKYRSLVPSLALLFWLLDGHSGNVGEASIRQAIDFSKYLESHARRIYATAVQPEIEQAKLLAAKIQRKLLPDGFSLRDVYRKQWAGLSVREDAERAVHCLIDYGWLRKEAADTAGRPKVAYRINPVVLQTP